jgi:hypothetical protein
MKTLVLAGVGLPGAVLSALAAWLRRDSHETPSNAVHPAQLLYGFDEYWNGDYPEGKPQ